MTFPNRPLPLLNGKRLMPNTTPLFHLMVKLIMKFKGWTCIRSRTRYVAIKPAQVIKRREKMQLRKKKITQDSSEDSRPWQLIIPIFWVTSPPFHTIKWMWPRDDLHHAIAIHGNEMAGRWNNQHKEKKNQSNASQFSLDWPKSLSPRNCKI